MRTTLAVLLVAVALSGCAVEVSDRSDASGQALARDVRAADCDRQARNVTSSEETVASAPWSSTPWTEANEWAVATAGSKAQIERDIRWRHYADCVGLGR